ncbi:MAG: S9 family peptidase [Candidatus Marinimicrobia bacterium]|nr:S9 family peptidase [Candidatus Neomarinimicrobiota bacterium]
MIEKGTIENPPVAKMIPKDVSIHEDRRIDNYFWLRERNNPEVLDYLRSENAYTETVMKHTEDLQTKLYEEMKGRIKETDLTVPVKIDDYYYYSRTEEGKQYSISCRKHKSLDANEEILLDQNELAEGYDYFQLGAFQISPNHQLLAYSVDTTGSEQYTLCVKDLSTDSLLPDKISNTYYSVEWANDNQTLFYNILDEAKRPYKVFRHTLGTDPGEDVLVYHEEDERFFLDIKKSKSKKYLFFVLESQVTSEVRYLDANNPTGRFEVIHPREHEHEYSVYHQGDRFLILTNDQAKNFRLMEAPITGPSRDNWKEFIPHREEVKLEYLDVFRDYLVVYERVNGLKKIRVMDLTKVTDYHLDFDEPVYVIYGGFNPDFNSTKLRFTYMSMITPRTVYDYDMVKKTKELKKQKEVLGGYDSSLYQTERIYATASDGKKVPMSILYNKRMEKNGKNPVYLYGYGAYGSTMDPYFSSNRFSLINRGFVFVIAHIRGGGYLGRSWYEDGKLLRKKNSFSDFISCAEHLIAEKYASPEHLVISGGSAGGLLIGAVVNMRPELFKAVVADVPFVDVVNTMLDPTIPLTVIEFEEWGNPADNAYYDYMKTYSPYDNVEAKDYPHLLITAGLNDPRVQYWEPTKWTAKLRAKKTDSNILLLKTNMGAGHGGPSGRYDYLKEIAFEYAFILDVLGMGNLSE